VGLYLCRLGLEPGELYLCLLGLEPGGPVPVLARRGA
jgi:hypothetical protein